VSLVSTRVELSILDPNGNVLRAGDAATGTNGTAAGAVISAPTSGTYYVRVADGGPGGDDDYRFVVLVLDSGDALAGAVLTFNLLGAQQQAEQTVDDCLTNFFFCDLDALLGSLDFLLGAAPVLAFAGSIGGGVLRLVKHVPARFTSYW